MTDSIDRRDFLTKSAAAGATLLLVSQVACADEDDATEAAAAARGATPVAAFEFDELTVHELQARMTAGTLTSRRLTEAYLRRIDAIDVAGPRLRSVIEKNPDALTIADAMDAERAAGKVRGPLHGIPVLIKDNIDTGDAMMTTAGSLALVGNPAPRDAFIIERLRASGAVLLGKTNLSEWANFRSTHSTSGWSGRGGQTRNPYVLDRNPCGSSAGTGAAIAANLAAVGIGTETDGSIICPSSINGLVGLKPTVGLWSRSGIIPISATQDTAGPMGRTVADVAVLLGALTGADPRDAATSASAGHIEVEYTTHLDANALRGKRIGIARNLAGFSAVVDAIFDDALKAMEAAGAVMVDRIDLPNNGKFDDAESTVLHYEFKAGLNAYLAERGTTVEVHSLEEVIAYNKREAAKEMPWFQQELFEKAQTKGPLTDAAYLRAKEACRRLVRTDALDATFAKHGLDAIVCPSNGPSWPTDLVNGDHFTGGNTSYAAVAGYPSITVPMGFTAELPLGLSFIGKAWEEGKLIGLGYAFEQATKARRGPKFLPSLGD